MLIKFLESVAGDDFSFGKGAEIDLPNRIAMSFVHAGCAVAIDPVPQGLQEPKRQPINTIPEVHTVVISKQKTRKSKK